MRQVRTDGSIERGGDPVFVSEPLAGEPVGIAETGSGHRIVRFADIDLCIIDRRTEKLHGVRGDGGAALFTSRNRGPPVRDEGAA